MSTASEVAPVRLFHFSDIHLALDRPGWQLRDFLNKRLPGWVNLRCVGRGKQFENAAHIMVCLLEEVGHYRPDCLVFSGDASALGFEKETAEAAGILGSAEQDGIPGLAVPGNHDYYTRAAAASGAFERYFAPWQKGKRLHDAIYPFARRIGPVWLVAVSSATGNRWFWDAAGSVGADQLRRLEALLDALDAGPRILVTHYPVCLSNGEPEHHHRGLRDLRELLQVAKRGRICLWLHGHRHSAYHFARASAADFPIICAGSATREGNGSYGDYTIVGNRLDAIRRAFSAAEDKFLEVERFELELPCAE
jgi:3',5'-cyclic AMP phosphodiesterase CpdA